MTTGSYNESAYEKAVLDLLAEEGWTVEYGPDIERDYSDPTWDEVLRERVFAINRDTPNEAINEALAKVKDIAGGSVVARNAAFTDCLQNGVEATCVLFGEERTVLVDLVDWAHPKRNAFHAVNQWTVQNGEITRRPDVVLFVNGLPLVVIELKNPSNPDTTVHDAFLQLRNYQKDIPDLFTFNQICVVSDMVSTKAGTITANESWFKEWKSVDGKKEDRAVGNFETLFKGLLAPERLLDVVKNFVKPTRYSQGTISTSP